MNDKQPRIVVVGSINMDLVLRVPRIVRAGETLAGSEMRLIPGGKGANQAVAAARLGADVAMVGRVGGDEYGQALLAGLRAANVDVSEVRESTGSSGLAWIQVDEAGENSIVILAGANGELSADDVIGAEATIAAADVLLLQLEIPMEAIVAAIKIAQRHDVPVQLDPAPASDNLELPWSNIVTLCPNEGELSQLTTLTESVGGTTDLVARARQLIERGVRQVVVTRGAQGAISVTADEVAERDGFSVQAVDTTAAGDAFRAAWAVATARRFTTQDSLEFANATGALAASQAGAQPSLPTREQVDCLITTRPTHP